MATARSEHRFQFSASQIAAAAKQEAEYHEARVKFWQAEYASAVQTVRATAGVEIKEVAVTGGMRADVVVHYGDPSAYRRMQEAFGKIQDHRVAAERYRTDERVYGSQVGGAEARVMRDPAYELDTDDVHYFRLGGDPRPE